MAGLVPERESDEQKFPRSGDSREALENQVNFGKDASEDW